MHWLNKKNRSTNPKAILITDRQMYYYLDVSAISTYFKLLHDQDLDINDYTYADNTPLDTPSMFHQTVFTPLKHNPNTKTPSIQLPEDQLPPKPPTSDILDPLRTPPTKTDVDILIHDARIRSTHCKPIPHNNPTTTNQTSLSQAQQYSFTLKQ
jgi:hypothetical protein